jgi:hypothetical protein
MGKIKTVQKVKLIVSEIYSDEGIRQRAESELVHNYDRIEFQSEKISFNFTEYYKNEMGERLTRRWLSFKEPIMPDRLAEIKVATNQIEEKFSKDGKRKINLDPGYVSSSSLVLASTKNYSHRIYLKDGIYAEITLIYEHGNWVALKWTYPDYRTNTAFDFFIKVRGCLK